MEMTTDNVNKTDQIWIRLSKPELDQIDNFQRTFGHAKRSSAARALIMAGLDYYTNMSKFNFTKKAKTFTSI